MLISDENICFGMQQGALIMDTTSRTSIGMHENSSTSAIIFFLSHRSLNLWFDTHWKIVHFEKHWIWDQINIKIPIGHGSNVKFSDTICMQLFEPWKYLFQSIFHQLDMVKCTAYGQFPRYRVMTNNKMTVQIYPIYSGVDVWFIITCIYIWL